MIVPDIAQNTDAVTRHYDMLDSFYREIWGDHVHHGYWSTGRESVREATEALVELLADRLALSPGQDLCDIGCGYGATAELLSQRHGVSVLGVTLSPKQLAVAVERAARRRKLAFVRRDWLANGCQDAQFDRAYAIESSEHMADKRLFFAEAFRTLRPGGRLGICAWLARSDAKRWEVRYLLEPICREGRLPGMGTEIEYRSMAEEVGFRIASFEDLSRQVRRTWSLIIKRVIGKLITDARYRQFLRDATASERIFALTVLRIWIAYRTGSMRYGLLTVEKPC